jgi:hypothetical protein
MSCLSVFEDVVETPPPPSRRCGCFLLLRLPCCSHSWLCRPCDDVRVMTVHVSVMTVHVSVMTLHVSVTTLHVSVMDLHVSMTTLHVSVMTWTMPFIVVVAVLVEGKHHLNDGC